MLKLSIAILGAVAAVAQVHALEVVAAATGNWSSTATWVGGVLPGMEDDVKIPAGITVTLNANVECGGILVEGKLTVERANRTLLCDSLLVQTTGAVFEVGTNASRFAQNFTLTLKGLSTESPLASMGAKLLGAHNGGTLDLHGKDRVEWTHLGTSAAVGATSLTLSAPVDWAVGDSILVTSSRASWNEAETRTITAVSPDFLTVSFTPGLTYPHNGSTITRTRPTDAKSWTADLRAEVGLLSRNVKIVGDAASETAGFGGHIMVMNGGTTCCVTGGRAFIEGVELFRMGQKSLLGRYPMHWHMVADGGAGQYFRDNVVRRSFNRAITIHGTESALVENNFCYDHIGHGIFLENGSERFNVIRRNVVALSKKPLAGEEILETDNGFDAPQNRSPSSFWITNPNNTFTDNVAAGTQGTGYWFAFPQKPLGASLTHPRFAALEPYKEPLGVFDRNTAHSSMMGLDINDQVSATDTLVINGEWANNGPFFFNDCTWYCNNSAIYAGTGAERKNAVYRNNVFSDNEFNLFLAAYQLCEESLMLADSGFGLQPSSTSRIVYAVYDGAGRMKKNHLVGYHAGNTRLLQNIGAATKHPNHLFESLTFDPPTPPRSVVTDYNLIPPADIQANDPGHPRIWASVILDVDGSISGILNSSIVSNHPWMLTGGETRPSVWTNTYRSSHRFAQCRLNYGQSSSLYPNISAVRSKAGTPTTGVYYINGYKEQQQLPLIVREDYLYTYYYESLPTTKRVIIDLNDATAGDHFVACFKDFGKLPGVAVTGMTAQTSLAALKAAATSSFFRETNGDFYIRPVATAAAHNYNLTWTTSIAMPVLDSDADGVSDGDEAAAGTDPFRTLTATDPLVNTEFNVAGNFEDWAGFTAIGSETVAGGFLSATSTTNDPRIFLSNQRISGTDVPYLLVRMRATQNGDANFFWERLGGTGYTAARSVTVNYSGANQWRVLTFPMSGNAEWLGQVITTLRFDPTSTSGVTFEIDWIRASDGNLLSTTPTQATMEDTPTAAIPVTLDDSLADATVILSATSSNPGLVPNGNISFGGTGVARTVVVTPLPNMSGTTTITLALSSGALTSSTTFILTVTGTADDNIKAATGSTLNVASAWTTPFVPINPDTATWNATSFAGTMTPGSALNWAGLTVTNPAAPLIFNGSDSLTLGSLGINMGAATVDVTLNQPILLDANQSWNIGTGRTLSASNQISGLRTLTKSGAGSMILSGSNTFTGSVNVSAGSLKITNSATLGSGPKVIDLFNGTAGACELHLDGSAGNISLPSTMSFTTSRSTGNGALINDAGANTIAGPVNMSAGGGNTLISVLGGSLTLDGNITSNVTTGRTLVLASPGNTAVNSVNGVIRDGSGPASLTLQSGTWSITAANTFTGSTTVTAGVLQLGGSLVSATTINGGILTPRGTPGIANNLTLGSGATLSSRINHSTPGTGYDQLSVNGTLTISGTPDLTPAPGLTAGTTFTLLNKTSAGASTGSFTGKPQGSLFVDDGYGWIISYTGGDGNDLTVTIATPGETWRYLNFGTLSSTGANADAADKDNDGISNLVEYATGTNPNVSDPVPTSATKIPGSIDFRFTKNKAATDVTCLVEWSDTLIGASWSSTGTSAPFILSDNGTTQQIKVIVPATNGVTRRFVRLKITKP
jgi:cell surface hyaluronidase